jgi:outer membrane protein OmpA-like peptidoglycan-associated protein
MRTHKLFLTFAILSGLALGVRAQEKAPALQPADGPWYIGIGGGTSFGQATFYSITEEGIRSWGLQGGLFGGYRFNRLISLEAGLQVGGQSQFNLDCCPYWLGTDGVWQATQVIDKDGWYFDDLQVATRWARFAVQANINMLSFIRGNNRWSLDISPQISVLNTKSKWMGNLSDGQGYHEELQPANWHLGLGGQVGAGFAITPNWKLGLYGGITALTGKRFDCIPNKAHNTNLIWDAGLKLTFSFGKGKKKAAEAAAAAAAAAEAARLAAAQQAAEQARIAAEQAAREKAAAEAAEAAARAAREQAAAEAAAKAAAEQAARYYDGIFPAIYFGPATAELSAEAKTQLQEVARIMAAYPGTAISLDGYYYRWTEDVKYSNVLTEKRLQNVKAYLVEQGVDETRIDPLTNRGIDAISVRSADARRVEINIVENGTAADQLAAREAEARRIAAAEAAQASGNVFGSVFFADSSADIDKDGMDHLREVKTYLDQHPDMVAVLFGFASQYGSAEFNKLISESRIKKVKEALVELGVPASRINPVVNKGVDENAKSSKDARRVDVFTVEK